MKKVQYILARVAGVVFLLILSAILVIQLPSVQSEIASRLAATLKEKVDADLSIGSIHILPTAGVLIKDISIVDTDPYTEDRYHRGNETQDTLFRADVVRINFSIKGLLAIAGGRGFQINRAYVDNGMLALVTEPSDTLHHISNLQRMFRLPVREKNDKGHGEVFSINKAEFDNFRFKLNNFLDLPYVYSGIGINWGSIDVVADVKAHRIHFVNGRMSWTVDRCSAVEKCGYTINDLTGSAKVGRGEAFISNLRIIDDFSDIRLKRLSMKYESKFDFRKFYSKVTLDGEFRKTALSFQSVKNFLGKMENNTARLEIQRGCLTGKLCDLHLTDMFLKDMDHNLQAAVECLDIAGFKHMPEAAVNLRASNVAFTPNGLEGFLSAFTARKVTLPEIIPEKRYNLSAKCKGRGRSLATDISLNTEFGGLDASGRISNLFTGNDLEIDAEVSSGGIELGELLQTDKLGKAVLSARVLALLGKPSATLGIDSLKIREITALGRSFSSISGNADIGQDGISATLDFADPDIKGRVAAVKQGDRYTADASIRRMDLMGLGLFKKEMTVAGDISADISGLKEKAVNGKVRIDELYLDNGEDTRRIDSLVLLASVIDGKQNLKICSDPLSGEVSGMPDNFVADLTLHDHRNVLETFVNDLYIADNTVIHAEKMDSTRMALKINSSRIALGKNYIKDAVLDAVAGNDSIRLNLTGTELGLAGSATASPAIHIDAGGKVLGKGEKNIHIAEGSSSISFNGKDWDFGESGISKGGGGLRVDEFSIRNESQMICCSGDLKDRLMLTIKDINLKVTDKPMTLNGTGEYSAGTGNLLADIVCRNEDLESLRLSGGINLAKKEVDASARIKELDLGYLAPLTRNIFSEMSGRINGSVKASGSIENLSLSSDSLRLENAGLRLAATNVCYTIDGPMEISGNRLVIPELLISDGNSGRGRLSGSVDLRNFKKISLEAAMDFTDLLLLNRSADSIEGLYGKLSASGKVDLNGPLDALKINADAATAGSSSVHVPLGSASAEDGKILTFVPPYVERDPYEIMIARRERRSRKKTSNLQLNAHIDATPDLEAVVEVDRKSGHMLTARGEGDINLRLEPSKDIMDLSGDYIITEGKYHFAALQSVAERDFIIDPGSSIKLNGKPADSRLDITARYKLKASLAPLTMDTLSVTSRRNVECILGISDRLSEPELDFDIDIPDIDPTTSSMIQSALNTDDKVQKQFVALLITGCFVPNEQSGIQLNGTNMVYTNLSSIMSSQINNILQTFNIPVDMGLNYQQNESGKNIFDVAISTQLFDNRVLVNGSIGNRQYNNGKKADVVGDIDIEVKIDKPGKFRFKLFSHSADDYTNFLDNTQRSGVGFTYQTEFGKKKKDEKSRNLKINE